MSSYRSRGVDRHAAEQLLTGAPVATEEALRLAAVLRTVTAPAHAEELAGEQAALAAFRDAAALDSVPAAPRPSMLKSALARLLTVKALILVAAAGSAGIVLAATGGALPGPWSEPPADPPSVQHSPSTSVLTSVPTSVPSSVPTSASVSIAPTGQPSDAGRPAGAGNAPAPSMAGLCRAYTAQVNNGPGKALDNPAFDALVAAAGGQENVPEYCAGVVTDQPHGKPSDLPTPAGPGNTGDPPGSRPATPPGQAHAPVSPVHGAAPAVPPSGARTPSPGG
jgi:hypothetical protein